jgi:hypothetical protein
VTIAHRIPRPPRNRFALGGEPRRNPVELEVSSPVTHPRKEPDARRYDGADAELGPAILLDERAHQRHLPAVILGVPLGALLRSLRVGSAHGHPY